jgi:hypothetical protein
MIRTASMIALVAALVAVGGCADRKHPLALQGTWRLTDVNSPQLAKFVNAKTKKKYLSATATTLTLNQKGEATLSAKSFDPGLGPLFKFPGANQSGTWEADGQNFKTSLSFAPGGQTGSTQSDDPGVPYTLTNTKTLKFSKEQVDLTWTKQ